MQSVFVADGDAREAIAITRSLGKQSLKVIVGSSERTAPAFFSKYTAAKFLYPDPMTKDAEFVQTIHKYLIRFKPTVLLAVRDKTTILFSLHKSKFEKHTRVPVADYSILKNAYDKMETVKIALRNDIPCPTTYFEVEHLAKKKLDFPLVIKPRFSSGARGVVYVNKIQELESKYKLVKQQYGEVIVQDYIPSAGSYGVSTLYNNGELRALFTHKRLREYPPTGGPSTFRVSTHHPEAEYYAKKLLHALNWHGVAMVEFRIDRRDKKPKLMEINPRFWGSLPLAIAAGVDFPYLLFKMAVEGDVKPVLDYKIGVQCRWLFGDILWYLSTDNKFANLPALFKLKGMNYDIISFDDFGPVVGTILDSIAIICNKTRRAAAIRR